MNRPRTVPAELAGGRVDVVVAELLNISRSQAQKLLRNGQIKINGTAISPKYSVKLGDVLEQLEAEAEATPAVPDLPVLYEDDDLMVINKPAGLAVHLAETGRLQPTVAAFAASRGVVDDDVERPGIVHRLDKDTSGAMVIAKHPEAKLWLQSLFKRRLVDKTYLALIRGRLQPTEAMINLPVGRDRKAPVKRAVLAGGREARTHYKVLREYPGVSLVEITLHTGRTHQIRVHMSHLGHPVIGDSLYGDPRDRSKLGRQFLHAARLAFEAPSGRRVDVEAPLPTELQVYLDGLRIQV